MDKILQAYTQPSSAGYYQSAHGLFSALRDRFGDEITFKQVQEFLARQKSHTLHTRQAARNVTSGSTARRQIVSSVGSLEIDVAYLRRYAGARPNHYLLVVVDKFSKYIWTAPLRTLTAASCKRAFKRILTSDSVAIGIRPFIRAVTVDQGPEFKNVFRAYVVGELELKQYFTHRGSRNKCPSVERSIGIIKLALGRAMESSRNNVVSKINAIVHATNNGTHSRTRPPHISASDLLIPPERRSRPNAPSDTCYQLAEQVIIHQAREFERKNTKNIVRGARGALYRIGDQVRITTPKRSNKFGKISDRSWSNELYSIIATIPTTPLPSYKLALVTPDSVHIPLTAGSFSEANLKLDHGRNHPTKSETDNNSDFDTSGDLDDDDDDYESNT